MFQRFTEKNHCNSSGRINQPTSSNIPHIISCPNPISLIIEQTAQLLNQTGSYKTKRKTKKGHNCPKDCLLTFENISHWRHFWVVQTQNDNNNSCATSPSRSNDFGFGCLIVLSWFGVSRPSKLVELNIHSQTWSDISRKIRFGFKLVFWGSWDPFYTKMPKNIQMCHKIFKNCTNKYFL